MGAPEISIVIPVYNESEILRSAITDLTQGLKQRGVVYELLIAENGSSDDTVAIAKALSSEIEGVETFSADEPNYGRALREGILRATGTYVFCDEIDLCDLDFYDRALELLRGQDAPDMVIGSKAMVGADDARPVFRRVATKVLNGMLRVALDFHGTDTHGLKAFRRGVVTPVVHECIIERDIFASEMVIRCGRAGLDIVEIPVSIVERRRPAISLARRVPNVVKNLARLTYVIRVKG